MFSTYFWTKIENDATTEAELDRWLEKDKVLCSAQASIPLPAAAAFFHVAFCVTVSGGLWYRAKVVVPYSSAYALDACGSADLGAPDPVPRQFNGGAARGFENGSCWPLMQHA